MYTTQFIILDISNNVSTSCALPKWPVAGEGGKLGGKSWKSAVETLLKLTSTFPMAILLGRAGMGKSQVAFEVCKRVDCIYIDMTELNEKNLANIAAVVAWRLLTQGLPEAKNRLIEAYRKFGYEGVLSLARGDPTWTLRTALELSSSRRVIVLDEFMPSAEDPKFFELAYILHRIRNMHLPNVSFLVTMLPEVYEKIVEKIPPLGNFFIHITVQLPDVIPEEELDEIVALYCPERVELARKIYRERPDLTVRELLIELNH
ncbi:MAG: AAA family ATPase, partial [Pyrobaculum sp.]